MRKRVGCITMVIYILLFISACTDQPIIETIESTEIHETADDEYGFAGIVIEDSDTYTESDDKAVVTEEKQEPNKSVETAGGEAAVSGSKGDADEKEDSADQAIAEEAVSEGTLPEETVSEEAVSEETEDVGPSQDNTYDGDLLEPPAENSAVVL